MRRLHVIASTAAFALLAFTLLAIAAAPAARAQMPMVDPVKMSGLPLPDPQLPAGSIVVRVLKGGFQTPLAGQEVTLDGPGGPRKGRSADDGRVRFDGLQVGASYIAHTTGLGRTLDSQAMQLAESGGVKVMLVHPLDEKEQLGEADGKARHDERLPRGTIEVRVYNEEATPQKGIKVVLGRVGKDKAGVDERTAETDAEGAARFVGLAPADDVAYAVKALRPGAEVASEPFRLTGDHGMLVALKSIKVESDIAKLRIADRSHFIVEVRDESVQVVENLLLVNDGQSPIDPGPDGLRLPLPDGAQGAEIFAPEGGPAPPLKIEGNAVVYKGRVPPGNTEIRVGLLLPIDGDTVTLRQTTPVPYANVTIVVDRYEGMTVEGTGLRQEERTLPGGRSFWLVSGPATRAGGEIQLRLAGLPHQSTLARNIAAAIAIALALWGLFAAIRRPARTAEVDRARVERRRQALLDELAAVEAELEAAAVPAAEKIARRRADLLAQLEKVYRELDEATA